MGNSKLQTDKSAMFTQIENKFIKNKFIENKQNRRGLQSTISQHNRNSH